MTTRLTLFLAAALIIAIVPLTAGLITSSSCFGYLIGKGEAVWTIKVAPSHAAAKLYSSIKSASANSNSSNN